MPLVRIAVPTHLPTERVRALADAVHEALVGTCDVPPSDHFQLISRFSDQDRIIDPTFPDVERSADAVIVEILLLAGRDDNRKRRLFEEIAKGAEAHGFRGDDIMVALVENRPIDWSLGGGRTYDSYGHD
ncbi:MAG: tautomerase family protein [Alphaproteobacteria bacterium]|nr:tautomerase family protein [Alphaproteobacteria bacterium]